jgi:hypothetical protein
VDAPGGGRAAPITGRHSGGGWPPHRRGTGPESARPLLPHGYDLLASRVSCLPGAGPAVKIASRATFGRRSDGRAWIPGGCCLVVGQRCSPLCSTGPGESAADLGPSQRAGAWPSALYSSVRTRCERCAPSCRRAACGISVDGYASICRWTPSSARENDQCPSARFLIQAPRLPRTLSTRPRGNRFQQVTRLDGQLDSPTTIRRRNPRSLRRCLLPQMRRIRLGRQRAIETTPLGPKDHLRLRLRYR